LRLHDRPIAEYNSGCGRRAGLKHPTAYTGASGISLDDAGALRIDTRWACCTDAAGLTRKSTARVFPSKPVRSE
jgi:hypothetical protein